MAMVEAAEAGRPSGSQRIEDTGVGFTPALYGHA